MTSWQLTAWAAAVRSGLRAKGVTVEDAAHRMHVPVSTFRAWLDGRHLPSVALFDHWSLLADLTGTSEQDLLRAAGILPDTFSSSLFMAQATREVRDSLNRAGQLLRHAAALSPSSGVAQVV